MKIRTVSLFAAVAVSAALATVSLADDAPEKGARVGEWTQDYDAARALSAETGLPLLLKFTGSDWCGWCMLMEKQVFSQKDFKRWASTNIVLVSVDFPRGKNVKTVPDDYRARNSHLATAYGVRGFPTYFVLSPSGDQIGRLGASRDATAGGFVADLERTIGTWAEKTAPAESSAAESASAPAETAR